MMDEVVTSSKASVNIYQTTGCNIAEESHLLLPVFLNLLVLNIIGFAQMPRV
jgi:hypothetical protein